MKILNLDLVFESKLFQTAKFFTKISSKTAQSANFNV